MASFIESVTIIIGGAVTLFTVIFGIALLFAFPTMWLWDWLIPTLFGLKEITLLQAAGINMLSGILFKSSASTKK
jgi:hypothetical protein